MKERKPERIEVSALVEKKGVEPTAEVLGKYSEISFQKVGGADARAGLRHQ